VSLTRGGAAVNITGAVLSPAPGTLSAGASTSMRPPRPSRLSALPTYRAMFD
jgi:hypothetical protein